MESLPFKWRQNPHHPTESVIHLAVSRMSFRVIRDRVSRFRTLAHFPLRPESGLETRPATSGLCVRRVGGASLGCTSGSRMSASVIGGPGVLHLHCIS